MYCTSYIITPLIPHFDSIEIPPIESPTIVPFLIGSGDQTGRPYILFYWIYMPQGTLSIVNYQLSIE